MKPLDEYLNDQLDQHVFKTGRIRHQASGFTKLEPARERASEIDELVTLALRLRRAPQLQVTPDFASQLERRLQRHHAEQRLRQGSKKYSLWVLLRTHRVLGVVLGLCICVCLLSTGLLALAAQVSDPGNPLYAIRHWEQHIQVQFSSNPADQAALDLQFARDRLNSLVSLATSAHAGAYRQGLLDLNQQVSAASTAINGLQAGSVHDHLAGELTNLKMDAIHVLRGLLGRLALSDRLASTEELRRLGDLVPTLTRAMVILPAHPNEQATIHLQGDHIEAGAQLLVNGNPVQASGILQKGQVTFVVFWRGEQHPRSLGILNPDGTAVQTTAITIAGASNGNPNGNGNKPTTTPTPHGNKPSATPTPHGNKSSAASMPYQQISNGSDCDE